MLSNIRRQITTKPRRKPPRLRQRERRRKKRKSKKSSKGLPEKNIEKPLKC